ncbi:hypothetical protein [Senegalia massiliensis]|uniref:hypothetical protein n=1 Tax=Senegalia massiliensis TaxID=1720316 RepID=UPI001030187E|nr:hypothetical protein [Senegalia massiliensis]
MKGKYLSILLIAFSVVTGTIYSVLYFVFKTDLHIISLILRLLIVFLGIYYLNIDNKKKLEAKKFIPFFIVEIIVFIINIFIYDIERGANFNTLELGITGGGIDVFINIILIIYILVANRSYKVYEQE